MMNAVRGLWSYLCGLRMRPIGWVAIVAIAALITAGWYANSQRLGAAEGRSTTAALTRLLIATGELNALEWELIASEGSAEVASELRAELLLADMAAEAVRAQDGDDAEVLHLLATYYEYHELLVQEAELLRLGRMAAALELDDEKVDPTFTQLNESIIAESGRHSGEAAGEELATFLIAAMAAIAATLSAVGASAGVIHGRSARRAADSERVALQRSESRFRALVQHATDLVTVIDATGIVTYASPSSFGVMGYAPEDLVGRGVMRFIHAEDRALAVETIAAAVRDGGDGPSLAVLRILHARGEYVFLEVLVRSVLDDASVAGVILNSRDITGRMLAEADQGRLTSIIAATTDLVAVTGLDGRVTFMNRAGRVLLGVGDAADRPSLSQFAPPAVWREIETSAIASAIASGGWSGESSFLSAKGDLVYVELEVLGHRNPAGDVAYLSWIARDVTDRKRFEAQMVHLANHDSLTGLWNWRRFEDELSNELVRTRRAGSESALLFFDIDNFKAVNDEFGHHSGDDLLRAVAGAIKSVTPEGGMLARLGGDEFAILLEGHDLAAATGLAEELRIRIRNERAVLNGHSVAVTASIGIALIPAHGRTSQELLMHADLAMYEAKEDRDSVHVFSPNSDYGAGLTERRLWEDRLRSAIEHDRLVLFAQPIIGLHDSGEQYELLVRMHSEDIVLIAPASLAAAAVARNELLVRMAGEDSGFIAPGAFLPTAERSGLVHLLDRWVLKEAIRLIATYNEPGRPLALAVNLSARSLKDESIAHLILTEIRRTGIDPAALILEITETAAIADIDEAWRFIEPLKRLGCRFAIDDFGVGFASFNYLKHLPVDHVKIDGSFIRNLAHDPQDRHLVRAMVEVAHGLGKRAVAECVEDRETLEILREFGVDYVQGFLLGRPAPVEEMLSAAQRRLEAA